MENQQVLRYNLRTGGNINTNERKRWYGLELYQGMNNQGYLAISNLDKSNYSVENLVMYNTKLGSWGNLDGTVGMTYEDYNFLNKNVVGTKFSVMEMREMVCTWPVLVNIRHLFRKIISCFLTWDA